MTTTPSSNVDPRESKLPKWAQESLAHLRYDLDRTREDLEALSESKYGDRDTDTIADPYGDFPLKLRKGEVIAYRLGYGQNDEVRVSVDQYGALQVSGARPILVRPRAANVVHIEVERT